MNEANMNEAKDQVSQTLSFANWKTFPFLRILTLAILFAGLNARAQLSDWDVNGNGTSVSIALVDVHSRQLVVEGQTVHKPYVCRGERIRVLVSVSGFYQWLPVTVDASPSAATVTGGYSYDIYGEDTRVVDFDTASFTTWEYGGQTHFRVTIRAEVEGMVVQVPVDVIMAAEVAMRSPFPTPIAGSSPLCNALAVDQSGLFELIPAVFNYAGGTAPWGPDCLAWSDDAASIFSVGANSGQAHGAWFQWGSHFVTATVGNTSATKTFDAVAVIIRKLKWMDHAEVLEDDILGRPLTGTGALSTYHYDTCYPLSALLGTKNSPVQYQMGATPRVAEAEFCVLPWTYAHAVLMKSTPSAGTGNSVVPSSGSIALVNGTHTMPMVPLPNTVSADTYTIPWRYSISGNEYLELSDGSPALPIYRTLAAPSPWRHTLVHAACTNVSGATADAVYDSLCTKFNTRNIIKVGSTSSLTYAGGNDGSYISLITEGSGMCGRWQGFFIAACSVHSINDVLPVHIRPNHWSLWNAAVEFAAAPAQGGVSMPRALFEQHEIVGRGTSYYDPAYGRPLADENAAVNLVIDDISGTWNLEMKTFTETPGGGSAKYKYLFPPPYGRLVW